MHDVVECVAVHHVGAAAIRAASIGPAGERAGAAADLSLLQLLDPMQCSAVRLRSRAAQREPLAVNGLPRCF
jgi:hypothetical protein